MAGEFAVRVGRRDEFMVCLLSGRLGRAEMPLLRLVQAAVEQTPPRVLLVDVTALVGGDLDALVLLLEFARDLRRTGAVVQLVGEPTGSDSVLPQPRRPAPCGYPATEQRTA